MRTPLFFTAALAACMAQAQCDFDPVIFPEQIENLCPGEEITLFTGDFDSFQWYFDGQPIDGATGPTHTVTYFFAGPYSVEVTHEGCTEMSPEIWVDGWMFLPPTVIHGGDEPVGLDPFGNPSFCEGQMLTLEMGLPYTENIISMNNGVPNEGETGTTLVITESGSYTASAAPAECPNNVVGLGVEITVTFLETQQPQIMEQDDQICAFPLGQSYTWYLNGEEIDEEEACITPSSSGPYTVFVDYGQPCQIISEPYLLTGVQIADATDLWSIYPNPGAGTINIAMDPSVGPGTYFSVIDMVGRLVACGWMPVNGLLQFNVSDLEAGTYMFQAARDGKALAPASRFTVVK